MVSIIDRVPATELSGRWQQFLYWARRFAERAEFDQEERDPQRLEEFALSRLRPSDSGALEPDAQTGA